METIKYNKETKAIKEHRCDYCNGIIRKDMKYYVSTHSHEGTIYNWKSHIHCTNIANELNMFEDCDEGLTGDIFEAHINEYHRQLMNDFFNIEESQKFSDVLAQAYSANFQSKLMYVIKHKDKLK